MSSKLIRITTVPLSLEKLLEGQLSFINQKFEVTAVAAEKDRLELYGRKNGINTFHVEMTREITPIKDLKALTRLYGFLRKEKPLIVHTHTPKAGIIGMLAAKMAGVPIRLHTVAGMPLLETRGAKRKILNAVERLTYSCATRIYPNSKGLSEIILQEKFISPEKLKILGSGSSNGIDTSYFDPALFPSEDTDLRRSTFNIPEKDFLLIFVGRLVADKGLNELIESFVSLNKRFPDVSLLLVGPFEQELDPIKEENLEIIKQHPKIFSVGYQEDVRPFFSMSNALVFPSYREGFPNVVMQAGAMGLPSIVTDINGCNEIIEEGVNGTIIPVKDPQALEKAMERMVTDHTWRNELKKNAREKITASYERKKFWNLLLEEYKSLEKEYFDKSGN